MDIDDLLKQLPDIYSPVDYELIKRAYRVASKAHSRQKRASGEKYVTHCVAVAKILADMHV
ncbi:MAG: hypothetical protein ISR58_20920, partial [Anaerolineales bacterium]|nr:hypothetical protein [Anaerolineales bacterium]